MARGTGGGAVRLGIAGFAATAVAYGPARVGYGLFLPEISETFGLSTEAAGALASGLQAGYLVALSATVLLVTRFAPSTLVAAGGASAVLGMLLVAFAPGITALAFGVVLAGMSAGFSWSPYNDLAEATLSDRIKGRVLSVVSTGTTLGIAAAGLVALGTAVAGWPWQAAWIGFVASGLLSAALNAWLLPGKGVSSGSNPASERPTDGWLGWLFGTDSNRLFAVAATFGAVNAFYWSFNAEVLSRAGGDYPNAGSILYIVLGVAGFVGLLTGDLVERFGLARVLRVTLLFLATGAGLLGAATQSVAAVGISSIIYGAGVMLMSALLSVWSSTVFPDRPSVGFTATLLCFGIGGVVGPAALGVIGGEFGLGFAFMAAATMAFLAALVGPPRTRVSRRHH